jgi:hypothetical protein
MICLALCLLVLSGFCNLFNLSRFPTLLVFEIDRRITQGEEKEIARAVTALVIVFLARHRAKIDTLAATVRATVRAPAVFVAHI